MGILYWVNMTHEKDTDIKHNKFKEKWKKVFTMSNMKTTFGLDKEMTKSLTFQK